MRTITTHHDTNATHLYADTTATCRCVNTTQHYQSHVPNTRHMRRHGQCFEDDYMRVRVDVGAEEDDDYDSDDEEWCVKRKQ